MITKVLPIVALALLPTLVCAQPVSDEPAEPALPLTGPDVASEVEAVVRRFNEMFGDLEGPRPIELFDRDNPVPQYLAEEEDDWLIGWEALEWYFHRPERQAVVEAMDMYPSNIRVRSLAPELALATWDIFVEMKYRRGPPLGERTRANAILRLTDDGWRFLYYAEAPKTTLAYVRDLYEAMASPEFRQRFEREDDPVRRP